ncbi:hypothetical protein SARC_15303 [Sphaeroforma arctica JP610]|uniref:Uncharacterized protein n=1 Tax=Sphaeroforma arctica JP610 TaxID=667725 RepID=A0A0L0F6F7_9EUKA|nr:hypothetical protein SARC_15303 [Sphaeroforma arctica JP610]KNC72146.1 hypothetical protein SARC_15303 [Sphaeroforma arctica JP610]|eukprot:XP_014146048.1 hypothetical protein SARC_15303 [Sphaeroforma arctica JP610]
MTDSAQTHKPAGRRMTLMGQATLMSQTDTNPSYPLGFMVMERNLDYDDFCKALVDRVLTKPVCAQEQVPLCVVWSTVGSH